MTREEQAFFNGLHQGKIKGRQEEEEKRAELIRQAILEEREACIETAEREHLVDPTGSPDDIAYDHAIDDVVRAISNRGPV